MQSQLKRSAIEPRSLCRQLAPGPLTRQKVDSTYEIVNFRCSAARGMASHPSLIGQPPKPAWTICAGLMPFHILDTCCGRLAKAPSRLFELGRSTNVTRSNGAALIGRSVGVGSANTHGHASVKLVKYSR